MKFGLFFIFALVVSCYHVNSLPDIPLPFVPFVPSLPFVPVIPFLPSLPTLWNFKDWTKDFVGNRLTDVVFLVHAFQSLVQNPPGNMTEAQVMARDAMIDLSYTSAERLIGPAFPLVILTGLGLKIQMGQFHNVLNRTGDFVQSLKYVTPEEIKTKGLFGLYKKSKAFVRKKTLDPARKMVQRNTIDPFDKVLQLAIAYMPDFFQMSDEDAAHWKEFESALTKDFKQFVAYRFLEDKEMANAKAKDVNDKARLVFKENVVQFINWVIEASKPKPPKVCKHCGHVLD